MSTGGGSGSSGTTKYEWNPVIGGMWGDDNQGALGWAKQEATRAFQRYNPTLGAGRIAPFTSDETSGQLGLRNLSAFGTPEMTKANTSVSDTLKGDYLNNPHFTNSSPWQNAERVSVGINSDRPQADTNEYMGQDNPYFRDVLNAGTKGITDAYSRGAQSDLRRAANFAGAFGGSGHQQAVLDNQSALGSSLANYTSGMRNQQFDRSANLREADIGRRLSGDQFNANLNEADIARRLGASQFNVGIADRNVDRLNQNRQLAGQSWDNERNRMMGAAGLAPELEDQQFQRWQNLIGSGNMQRSMNQALLDQTYNDWSTEMNYGRNSVDWLANIIGRAQGATGISTTQNSPTYGGINPAAGILGAASLWGALR